MPKKNIVTAMKAHAQKEAATVDFNFKKKKNLTEQKQRPSSRFVFDGSVLNTFTRNTESKSPVQHSPEDIQRSFEENVLQPTRKKFPQVYAEMVKSCGLDGVQCLSDQKQFEIKGVLLGHFAVQGNGTRTTDVEFARLHHTERQTTVFLNSHLHCFPALAFSNGNPIDKYLPVAVKQDTYEKYHLFQLKCKVEWVLSFNPELVTSWADKTHLQFEEVLRSLSMEHQPHSTIPFLFDIQTKSTKCTWIQERHYHSLFLGSVTGRLYNGIQKDYCQSIRQSLHSLPVQVIGTEMYSVALAGCHSVNDYGVAMDISSCFAQGTAHPFSVEQMMSCVSFLRCVMESSKLSFEFKFGDDCTEENITYLFNKGLKGKGGTAHAANNK